MFRTETEESLYHLFEERASEVRAQHASELWQAVMAATANPITAGTRALFLHWSDAEHVQLVGDWTYWQPSTPIAPRDRAHNSTTQYSSSPRMRACSTNSS